MSINVVDQIGFTCHICSRITTFAMAPNSADFILHRWRVSCLLWRRGTNSFIHQGSGLCLEDAGALWQGTSSPHAVHAHAFSMAAPSQIIDSGVHSRPGVHSHRPLQPFWLDSIVKSQVLRLQRTRCTQRAHGAPSQAEGSVAKPVPRVDVIHPPGTYPDGEQAQAIETVLAGFSSDDRV